MDKSLDTEVRRRARHLCEYCRFPEVLSELRHVVDHVVARQHNGATVSENLALACARCNRHKGPNIAGVDPESGEITRLFNPPNDQWKAHFRWNGARLTGVTDIGRTTIHVLAINHPHRVAMRGVILATGKLRHFES